MARGKSRSASALALMTKSLNEGAGCVAGGGLELLAQLDGLLHVDLDGEDEVGRGRLRLGHPPRDGLLQPREVLLGGLAAAGLLVAGDDGRGDVLLRRLLLLRGGAGASSSFGGCLLLRRGLGLGGRGAALGGGLDVGLHDPAARAGALELAELDAHLARHPLGDGRGLDAVAAAVAGGRLGLRGRRLGRLLALAVAGGAPPRAPPRPAAPRRRAPPPASLLVGGGRPRRAPRTRRPSRAIVSPTGSVSPSLATIVSMPSESAS